MKSLLRRFARPFLWAAAVSLCALPALATAQQTASFAPNDARIVYSDYACAHIDAQRAGFDRQLEGDWICHQEEMSPGVRATFLVNATHIRFGLEYLFAGFLCGLETPIPLSWEFGLIVDGVRRPTGARNPLYPMTPDDLTAWVTLGTSPMPHRVTLVWPSGADVDLRSVELRQGTGTALPALLPQPPRAQPILSVFGDSIMHGLNASHVMNTLPVRLGILEDWSVINLGFAGRTTQPTDAWLAAGLSACLDGRAAPRPDLLLLSIGSNDFHSFFTDTYTKIEKFEQRYRDWLEQFRLRQPTVPILCLTPLPRGDECRIKNRTLEEYRERIRALVEARADARIYLFEGRDLVPLPPRAGDPAFDSLLLHPNDLGFEQITARLSQFNLVRNPSFSLRPQAGCLESATPEPYLWTNAGTGTSQVTSSNNERVLALAPLGSRTQLVYGLSAGDVFTLRGSGLTTGEPGRISLEYLDASNHEVAAPVVLDFPWSTWRRVARQDVVPAGAVRGRLRIAKAAGTGQFLVDELELTVAQF
jgi:lysophospholipase L1-like esterase